MALRKVGKYYHILYRDLSGAVRTRATGETDKDKARIQERVWMAQLKAERIRRRHGFMLITSETKKTFPDKEIESLQPARKRKRLKLVDWLDPYCKYYGEPSIFGKRYFNRFAQNVGYTYFDEITPQIAFDYLDDTYGELSGKAFNEAKTALNAIFKRLLLQANIERSPFDAIARRPHAGDHWRDLSDDEIIRLLKLADLTQKTAIMIAYFTGLRKSSIFALKWSELQNDQEHDGYYFFHLPPKTARFNRHVVVPVNDEFLTYLQTLPRVDDYIMGFDRRARSGGAFNGSFGDLFRNAGVLSDERGIASFGSFRKNFITRCDKIGMRRTATRGIVGQVSDEITDIYSTDYAGALVIKKFQIPTESCM